MGDEVSDAAIVGACAARSVESKGDSISGSPQLEPHATGPVEGKGGLKATDHCKSMQGRTIN